MTCSDIVENGNIAVGRDGEGCRVRENSEFKGVGCTVVCNVVEFSECRIVGSRGGYSK